MTDGLFEGAIKPATYQMTKAGLLPKRAKESLRQAYKPDEARIGAVVAEGNIKRFDQGQSE